MRKIKGVLRLHHEVHLSERRIADICLVGKGTVQRYLERAAAAGLAWPLAEELDDTQLEKLLFPPPPAPAGQRPLPDFNKVHHELKSNRSVTLQLLWQEYKENEPEGINFTWFCDLYREWAGHLDVVLRQDHRAGEKMFVDHAGDSSGAAATAESTLRLRSMEESSSPAGLPRGGGGYFYSTPYQLAQQQVEIRYTTQVGGGDSAPVHGAEQSVADCQLA